MLKANQNILDLFTFNFKWFLELLLFLVFILTQKVSDNNVETKSICTKIENICHKLKLDLWRILFRKTKVLNKDPQNLIYLNSVSCCLL